MNLYSTTDAAASIGCTDRTVRRICERHNIGRMVGATLVLTAADIERVRGLKRDGPGNPTFGTPDAPPVPRRKPH